MFPEGSHLFHNQNGTAPGMVLDLQGKLIITLPGPPSELKKMFVSEVIPYLINYYNIQKRIIKSKVLRVYGIGESAIEEEIKSILENQTNPTIALLAKQSEINIRITAKASDENIAQEMIEEIESKIMNKIGRYVFSTDDKDMEDIIAELLKKNKMTIALAESCTGGLISDRLTNIPGSSEYFDRSVVCYSNKAKVELLNIDEQLINMYGAVSPEVAIAMAEGIRKISNTNLGLAVTGIAGPDGGTAEKPVGLVYIALATQNGAIYEKHMLAGGRKGIKYRASQTALDFLRKYLLNLKN
ncbi:MAG TPA: CinA family nicotinamide mononucleotide deamidase-related protein, partial [Clostridia bacterium]|nr:CinA family nicotinamide mononucleotide deamidase-related protein [Clostridia bacterium]